MDTPNLTDAICEAVRQQWPELFREKKRAAAPRPYPRGVYSDRGRWPVAKFFRRIDGKSVEIRVARGEPGDFSPATLERLARACRAAAATWDEAHGR